MICASVIIPAYNAARYIGTALASAREQSESRIEILVIDDCSTDETPDIIREAERLDARVRLLRTTANGGPAAARNRGLAAASGTWLALLDADDRFLPQRVERLIALGEQQSADVVADNLVLTYEDGSRPPHVLIPPTVLSQPRRMTAAEFVARNVGGGRRERATYGFLNPVFRRSFLEAHGLHYDERNRFGEDFMLSLRCLTHGAEWWLAPEPMYEYTVRRGSLTEVQTSADLDRIRALDRELLADPALSGDAALQTALLKHVKQIDRCYYYRAFTDAVKAGRFETALSIMLDGQGSLRHIASESLVQAPTILTKALRGGYRRGFAAPK